MTQEQINTIVGSFIGGFVMTWLRGFSWFTDAATYGVAFAGGVLCTWLAHPANVDAWMFGVMSNTLVVLGGVKFGADAARVRSVTNLPAAVLPKYNELSNGK